MRSPRPSAIAACAACLAPALSCAAQATLDSDFLRAYQRVEYTVGPSTHAIGGPVVFDDCLDRTWLSSGGMTEDGFQAGMAAYFNVAFSPSDPGPGGAFSGFDLSMGSYNSILEANPLHDNENAAARSSVEFDFSVGEPMLWSFLGALSGSAVHQGTRNCRAWFDLELTDTLSGAMIAERHLVAKADGSFAENLDLSGALEPGAYLLSISAGSLVNNQFQSGTGTARVDFAAASFALTPIPAPAAAVPLASLLALRRRPRFSTTIPTRYLPGLGSSR